MKTCNLNGYCNYKMQGMSCYWVCNYQGYCDHQAPRDSRSLKLPEAQNEGKDRFLAQNEGEK